LKPTPGYDLSSDAVKTLPAWSRTFLEEAAELGAAFAPCSEGNWHIDGWDCYGIAQFSVIWGAFLTPLQKGNMGNLIV
jgi:hypothetical protein